VIAADVDGIAEVIQHEHNGLLCEVGNPSALASAIERVALDRDLLATLTRNISPPKSVVQYVEHLSSIYHEVAAQTKRLASFLSESPRGR
jgi:glycosyltransferase involved in cell wall biosynthesis